LAIYAALQVPEVWRLVGDKLTFHILGTDGTYQTALASRTFPLVTSADLVGFVQQARGAGDENLIVRQFRERIRRRMASPGTRPSS
jgi:hypothetical protein